MGNHPSCIVVFLGQKLGAYGQQRRIDFGENPLAFALRWSTSSFITSR